MTKELKFDEVLKGDKIRSTTTYPNGTEVVVTGVAAKTVAGGLDSEDGVCMASSAFQQGWDNTEVKIELLYRVEPKDHVVIGTLKNGSVDLARFGIYTKAEAEKEAASLNETYSVRISKHDKYAYSKYKAVSLAGL